jgi:hypothetical protein
MSETTQTTTQRTEAGTKEAREVVWDLIAWFEATNGTGMMPHRIYDAARKVIPECCGGSGRVRDAPCEKCGERELLSSLGCEIHAEVTP